MRRIATISILLLGMLNQVLAQSEGTFSQYMFNGLAINPAYAGSHESLSISALSRFQSIGLDGAPITSTFTMHSTITNKMALGLLAVIDEIGITNQTGVYLSYAYRINFENSKLAFGLQGGFNMVKADFRELRVFNPGDPLFPDAEVTELNPNFGAGIYYYSRKFNIGFSVPQLLESNKPELSTVKPMILYTGYLFTLSPVLKLKPNLLVRLVDGDPVEINYNTNLLIHDVVWVGFSYRPTSSFNTILELQLSSKLRLGYAYDFTLNSLGDADSGSHEIMLNYLIRLNKKGVISPRYF